MSRASYIAEALEGSSKRRIYSLSESQERKEKMLTKPCSEIPKRNVLAVSGAQLDGEAQDMTEVMHYQKKIRCTSSKGKTTLKKRRRTSMKMLSFIVNPRRKPVKKRRGFRRRTGRPSNSYTVDGHGDSKRVSMAKSLLPKEEEEEKQVPRDAASS